ncbi:ribonuclease H [Senna tora]|uniref:Ribonuclease H n=1 Tax=Senna tora TaxID=362788 RepID=A0A834TJF3_9FABA|nr:ribonuclease H [Senna tora]
MKEKKGELTNVMEEDRVIHELQNEASEGKKNDDKAIRVFEMEGKEVEHALYDMGVLMINEGMERDNTYITSMLSKDSNGESMRVQTQNKEGEEVLMEIGNIIMAKEMEPLMKENINPETCIKGVKKWKKIAREINETWRDLLLTGLYKNVGNGETTMVWKECWIPGVKIGELNPRNEEATRFTRVCEFFETDGLRWNKRMLDAVFERSIVDKIMCIPLTKTHLPDRWAWQGEASGNFTVKSGYKRAMMESWEHINLTPGLFCDVPTIFWKSVWKLPVLSRFKVMFWRICLGIIPTVDALKRRGMQINESCVLCEEEPENVFHLFFECKEVRQVWESARFNYLSWQFHNSILEWMSVEWGRWEREKQCVFIMAVYYIWEARNKKKFANEAINLNGVWARVERQWDELCVAGNGILLDADIPRNLLWEKPRAPYLKLNVDAATRRTGEGALGGVFRDCEGLVQGAFMASAHTLNDSTLLEALSIKKGVEVTRQLGVSDLIVESDARLVTDMLNSNCNHASLLSSICLSILEMCIGFNEVQFQWVPRSCNLCADSICKAARNIMGEQVWQDAMPICITEACKDDLH